MKIVLSHSEQSLLGFPQDAPEICKGKTISARKNFANWLEANAIQNFPINEDYIIPKPINDVIIFLHNEAQKGNFPVVKYENLYLYYRAPKYQASSLYTFSERVSIVRVVDFNEKGGLWTIQATPLGYENVWRLEKDTNNYVSYKKIIQKEKGVTLW